MSIGFTLFTDAPYNTGTAVDQVDVFEGDGTTTDFDLVNLTGLLVGDTVIVDAVTYRRSEGGFSVSGDTIVFAEAPPDGSTIVVPGVGYFNLSCTDTDGTNVALTQGFAVDPDTIHEKQYIATPPNTAILLSLRDWIAASGAEADWFQLALMNGDGTEGTYMDPGEDLEIPARTAVDNLAADQSGDDIEVTDGTRFEEGDIIHINPGRANQEIVMVVSIAGDVLTTSGLNYSDHVTGESVYVNGVGFFIKATVPDNAAGHLPVALADVCPRLIYRAQGR